MDGISYDLTAVPKFTTARTCTVYYEMSAPSHNTVTGQNAFTINAATDNAISGITMDGWTFGEKASTLSATPVFIYSDSENEVYT